MTSETSSAKRSKVEAIKEASHGLAGSIAESLQSDTSHFGDDDLQLIKFHGSYEQDDRDVRAERRREKLDKAWMYMVRLKMPGGRMTAAQYLACDDLAGSFGNSSLRLTSRQGIQFHGVGRENLKNLIKAINDIRLTTLGACGDVNRNTMCCCVSSLDWRAGLGLQELCADLAREFAPQSTAYWEIWCDGEKWGEQVVPNREEPLYGTHYLPRKFKMAVAVPEDNDVDLYTQDLGWEAVHEGGRLIAWDVLVGGGMGFSHGQKQTYPRLATRLVRCLPAEALEVARGVVTIQRDHGGREDRKHARLKYLMDDRGPEWFKGELFARLGRALPDPGPVPEYGVDDHLGWHEANDGKLYVGIHIANGRIADHDQASLRAGLREIVSRWNLEVGVTPKQNFILIGIDPAHRGEIERVMAGHGLQTHESISALARLGMACVALPTCGLALAESERYMPSLLRLLEGMGVGDAPVEIRMTGCPNSCVRTPTAEIGIAGRGPGKYALYMGGNQQGTRLAPLVAETVTDTGLGPILRDAILAWREQTGQSRSFGDWALDQGPDRLAALAQPHLQ